MCAQNAFTLSNGIFFFLTEYTFLPGYGWKERLGNMSPGRFWGHARISLTIQPRLVSLRGHQQCQSFLMSPGRELGVLRDDNCRADDRNETQHRTKQEFPHQATSANKEKKKQISAKNRYLKWSWSTWSLFSAAYSIHRKLQMKLGREWCNAWPSLAYFFTLSTR